MLLRLGFWCTHVSRCGRSPLPIGQRMNPLPRLALATPATGPEPAIASLGWLAGLTDRRWRVQHFRSRSCPTVTEVVGQVTGLAGRHLDAWLMPEDVCRRLFVQGTRGSRFRPGGGDTRSVGATPGRLLVRGSARGPASDRRDAGTAGGCRAAVSVRAGIPLAAAARGGGRGLPRWTGRPGGLRAASDHGRVDDASSPCWGPSRRFPSCGPL